MITLKLSAAEVRAIKRLIDAHGLSVETRHQAALFALYNRLTPQPVRPAPFSMPSTPSDQHPLANDFEQFCDSNSDCSDPPDQGSVFAAFIAGYNLANSDGAVPNPARAEVQHTLELCEAVFNSAIQLGHCAKFADATGGPMGNVIELYARTRGALQTLNQTAP